MPTFSELRTGLATNLATISGLRTANLIPDQVNPPIAIITPETITYDTSFARGLDEYNFTILVVVHRVAERSAQSSLDAFCNPTGSTSIKTAIESDRSLGGKAQTLRVTNLRTYQALSVGDVDYLAAEFSVVVYA
jgi:hypothetical protein